MGLLIRPNCRLNSKNCVKRPSDSYSLVVSSGKICFHPDNLRNETENSLTIWKPSPECFPNHVSANSTVRLHFQESATALLVARSAVAGNNTFTVIQTPMLVIETVALACPAGWIVGVPRVHQRHEIQETEPGER